MPATIAPLRLNSSILERLPRPTPAAVRAARERIGFSQTRAAALVSEATKAGYKTWAAYETPEDHPNHRAIPLASWEVFLLLTQQHPSLRLLPRANGTPEVEAVVGQIARDELGVETLELRNSDALDFYDLSVTGLRRALVAAYNAGRLSAEMATAPSAE